MSFAGYGYPQMNVPMQSPSSVTTPANANKGASGTTTQTDVTTPWAGQQPYLLSAFNQAQNLFNYGGPQYFPGQTYAGPTDAQLAGVQAEANLGYGGTNAQNWANPALQNFLSSGFLGANPSNPFYNSAASG